MGTGSESAKGELQPIASRILMRATQGLASRVTKWSTECDTALHRLMCYSTVALKMTGFVGDPVDKCNLWLFADSDHAGEHDNRSTSRCLLALVGPKSYFPLTAFSKKQTSTAMSSTEAEVTAANLALRAVGLPSSCLWFVLRNAGGDTTQKAERNGVETTAKNKKKDALHRPTVEGMLCRNCNLGSSRGGHLQSVFGGCSIAEGWIPTGCVQHVRTFITSYFTAETHSYEPRSMNQSIAATHSSTINN